MEDITIPLVQCAIWIDCSKCNPELLTHEDKQFLSRIPKLKNGSFELSSDKCETWDTGETIELFLDELPDDAISFLQKYADSDFINSSLTVPIRFGSTSPSLYLSRKVLDKISMLGLDIDFDIYSFCDIEEA